MSRNAVLELPGGGRTRARGQATVGGKPWDKTPPAPHLPREVIEKTAAKYGEALQRLTA